MTPDLERLTKAAWDAGENGISQIGVGYQGGLTEDVAEQIVRAVLGSLFTRSFVEAVARRYENGDPSECLSVLSLEMAIDDEISAILAEPAKA